MDRPTTEQVDFWLRMHDRDGKCDAHFDERCGLAVEVRALREDYAQAKALAEAAHAKRLDAEATLARVEALVPAWRRKARELRGYDVGMHEVVACADELETALKDV